MPSERRRGGVRASTTHRGLFLLPMSLLMALVGGADEGHAEALLTCWRTSQPGARKQQLVTSGMSFIKQVGEARACGCNTPWCEQPRAAHPPCPADWSSARVGFSSAKLVSRRPAARLCCACLCCACAASVRPSSASSRRRPCPCSALACTRHVPPSFSPGSTCCWSSGPPVCVPFTCSPRLKLSLLLPLALSSPLTLALSPPLPPSPWLFLAPVPAPAAPPLPPAAVFVCTRSASL